MQRPAFECRVFRGVLSGFRDDNFLSGWTRITGDGTFTTDGDLVTITNGTGSAAEVWEKTTSSLSSTTYGFITGRGKINNTTNCVIRALNAASGSLGTATFSSTSYAWREGALVGGDTITKFRVEMAGATAGHSATVDFGCLTKSAHLNATPNLAGFATSRFLGWRVGSANIVLKDIDADYWNATPINVADMALLYAGSGASPTADTKIFGGLVNSKGKVSVSGTRYTNLVCVDWTKALESVIVDKRYVAQDDDVLVDDLIDIVRGAAASPFNVKTYWELINSTNTLIDLTTTNLTLEWRQVSALEALTELAEILSIYTASGKGADFVCTPSEGFVWDLIGSTGGLPRFVDRGLFIESDYISLDLSSSSFDLRTQVNLIGRISIPSDGDDWTETTDVWSNDTSITHVFNTQGRNGVGAKQLNVTASPQANNSGIFKDHTLDFTKLGGTLIAPRLILLYHCSSNLSSTNLRIRLEKDSTNYFEAALPDSPTTFSTNYSVASLVCGPNADIVSGLSSEGTFSKTGTLTWTDITRIHIIFDQTVSGGGTVILDGFSIEGNVLEIAKQSTSPSATPNSGEAQYGKRELTVYDPTPREVTSTTGGAGHRERAKAELFKWRKEIIQGSMVLDNKLAINPGDSLQITSSPFNFTTKAFRVTGIHQFWNSFMDYIQSTIDMTDFLITTFPRGAGGLYGLLVRQGFLGRYETQLTALRENELIGGIPSNTTEYSS